MSDHGPGIPATHPPAGHNAPVAAAGQPGPRGLWVIRQACTGLDITTDATGARLLLTYRLDGRLSP
ncbi:ATP-binding protein [Actinoplanes utahensis]|uniref:Histidine kinase/HSP90-like ATPase domain-containing protein n=1 Tax=Actinoplanes utahensis TaxID=1869 RepID=A0A0A6UBS7_ACTUT|nr:ATP-binding protein [Actinoplanes utahensis]KHD73500.1 hypothetical protein MB27_33610 [Actinoplanes utahensis]GIF33799.1 hypothetical protein Aut01nite_67850 [Actinoplanes utahensis]